MLILEPGISTAWAARGMTGWGPLSSVRFPHPASLARCPRERTRTCRPREYRLPMCDSVRSAEVYSVEEGARRILDVLFPPGSREDCTVSETMHPHEPPTPTRASRERAGREAQGYMMSDSASLRGFFPQQELTYGEYDLSFFFSLVDECLSIRAGGSTTHEALESQARCEQRSGPFQLAVKAR